MPYCRAVQATVSSFDPHLRAGTVLTDEGLELSYGPDAFAGSGLRHLRVGQRVAIETGGTGRDLHVVALRLYTLH